MQLGRQSSPWRVGVLDMVTVRLTTWVNAPVERCFRLATCAELNALDPSASKARGTSSAALRVGDTVSREAWRWGLRLSHACRIDEMRPSLYFREVLSSGGFRHYVHEHHFAPMDDGTRMRDEVQFVAPMGPMGELLGRAFLKKYVMKTLIRQHKRIKRAAESVEWRTFLRGEPDPDSVSDHHTKVAKMQRFA